MGFFDFFKKKKTESKPAEQLPKLHYRVADAAFWPVGAETWVARRAGDAPAVHMASFDAVMLEKCTAFRTVAEHARTLGDSHGLDRNEVRELEERLDGWASAKLLVSSREVPRGQAADGVADLQRPPKEQALAVLERIAKTAGISFEDVRSACEAAGLEHNAAILASAGTGVLLVDDAFSGRVCAAPSTDAKGTRAADDPREWWAADDEPRWVESPVDEIIRGFAGRSIGASLSEPLSMPAISRSMFRSLLDPRTRVVAAGLGAIGGTREVRGELLLSQGPSRTRLVDEGIFFDAESAIRVAPKPSLGVSGSAQCLVLAIDARSVVPPLFGAPSDYGWTLGYTHPSDVVMHLPFAAEAKEAIPGHDPRTFPPSRLLRLAALGAPRLTQVIDPAARMIELGAHFLAMATASEQELARVLGTARVENLATWVQLLESEQKLHTEAPQEWTSALDEFRESLDRSLLEPPVVELGAFRASLEKAGFLLSQWPRLFEAARGMSR